MPRLSKILAGVYNPIAYDGRVQRSCEALAEDAEVDLVCPVGPPMSPHLPFRVREIHLPELAKRRIRRYFAFSCHFVRIALATRPDLVCAHNFYMSLPGLLAARLTGSRLVYDAHELIVPERGRSMNKRGIFWYWLERLAVRRADLLIAANSERAHLMRSHYSLNNTPLVIRNIPQAPTDNTDNLDDTPCLKKVDGEVLFVYEGDLCVARGLDRLVAAFAHLPPNMRLVMVGTGPDEAQIHALVHSLGLVDRCVLMGRVPRKRLHAILRRCDVGLLSYPYEGQNNIYCSPNKIFEYAQAGLPVVSTDQPPLRAMVAAYGIGELIGHDDSLERVAAVLRQVGDNPQHYRSALPHFLAEHRWEEEAHRLQAAVQRLSQVTT